MQTKFYGVRLPDSDIPRFADGTLAIIEQQYGCRYGGWRWTDGCIPTRVHPDPVTVEMVGRMHRPTDEWDMSAADEWDWEQEALAQESAQRDFLAKT